MTEDAQLYEHQRLAFQLHARVFAVSMIVIFLVNWAINAGAGITGNIWAWWSGWALIGWGPAIAVHGIVVRMARPRTVI